MMNKVLFGIDIGGTTVKCGLFTLNGELLEKSEIPTYKQDNGSRILSDVAAHIRNILEKRCLTVSDVAGVGIGVPGAVTPDGIVNKCVNLGWDIKDVAKEMQTFLPVFVKVGNDANMAALGEFWKGSAKGYQSVMLVTVGTGVGGGLIIDGKPVAGVHGAAAEIGHLPIVEGEQEACNCGKKGCLEQAASATGIVRVAKRILAAAETESVLRNIDNLTAKDVFDAAQAGDALAVQTAETVCEYLGRGLACVAAVVDPECFLIGGGVSKAGKYFTDLIGKYYQKHAFHPSRGTKIVTAQLGNDAGMYGAAKLAADNIKNGAE